MCGIAGAIDLNGRREFSASRLLAMTGAIAHRGPDDEQIHLEPGVALGCARLSIVDLAGGRQPISNEDGSIWVTQNGEIFEYPELQTELVARGHRLATRCDTELWAHLYEDLGEGFFEKARGQFAVALWDRNKSNGHARQGPGRHLSALLHRGRRLAALGLGDQGTSGLGPGDARPDPEGDRPLLQHVLRGHDTDVFRGDQVDPARAIFCGCATAGSSSRNTGTSIFPMPAKSAGSTTRLRSSTSWNS